MATLEKRIADLEAKTVSTDRARLYLCNGGEDKAQARAKAGIPPDYAGKVVCVQFVEPGALKEQSNGND